MRTGAPKRRGRKWKDLEVGGSGSVLVGFGSDGPRRVPIWIQPVTLSCSTIAIHMAQFTCGIILLGHRHCGVQPQFLFVCSDSLLSRYLDVAFWFQCSNRVEHQQWPLSTHSWLLTSPVFLVLFFICFSVRKLPLGCSSSRVWLLY
ncbi:hypothetical protein BDY21DRAFT_346641 [Lineolata rhizophorae]|uniref:Uncharacterized protein n=1 Tax=Lineolata rhizophorae TaxID=578093 RepID=A0A6A6P0I3_9PEZI|nr:hypothetical protein BDY21DRAFT_346641 [Lineolata rhizophorae]